MRSLAFKRVNVYPLDKSVAPVRKMEEMVRGKNMIEPSKKSALVSYAIRDIVLEANELEKEGIDMTWLNIGDPAIFGFKPPQNMLKAISDATLSGKYTGYCPSKGDPELIEIIARREGVQSENVFITNGLSEGVDFLYQAMLDPGESIVLPSPTYPLYLTKEKLASAKHSIYKCYEKSWEPNLDNLRDNLTPSTKAILVINPNNPTGIVYSRKTMEGIVKIAEEAGIAIIADDAYENILFGSSRSEYVNMRDIHGDVPLISGGSISKNYLYPGARVGWLTFHGEGLDKIKDAVQRLCNQRLSINWEMQRGAIEALSSPNENILEFNRIIEKRSKIIVDRISKIDGLSVVAPKGAFYAFVKIENMKGCKDDWEFVRKLLREGLVVVPGSAFSKELSAPYFRMTLLPDEETLGKVFDKLEKFMI